MEMKQKTAHYSVALLFFVFAFGLYQAKQQNKNPFAENTHIENFYQNRTVLNNSYISGIRIPNESSKFNQKSMKLIYFE